MTAKKHLPPGLRARRQASGKVYYYLKNPKVTKEQPLGSDREAALLYWRDHVLAQYLGKRSVSRALAVIEAFKKAEIPISEKHLSLALQRQTDALTAFFAAFDNPELTTPFPTVEAYFDYRGPRYGIRAGAEIRLFIHVWGWAQRVALISAKQVCPWDSNRVRDRLREDVLRELGDALHFFASNGDSLSPAPPAEYVRPPPSLFQAEGPVPNQSAQETSRGLRVLGAQTDGPTLSALASQSDLHAFLGRAAKQFTADGRRDLAREVRRLPVDRARTLLKIARESVVTPRSESQLVLGTNRAPQLKALKLARAAKVRQK
ncbi:hypothetical protein LMG28614_05503 [Paraburkholderia ultramafica]|uniref:Uncharacterized protein n=1 Tax=Paraburkholderia ultramafica TaxID=1544867 RepID=A0A6S7BTC3_9BURK|nr:phage integrase Arm DNA-binding domain-containing protein [Paraburkholderia ultramafica]CAB3801829.1 hypothetical protein LMG28614_05503 [Paraburkholderia ultramafica]